MEEQYSISKEKGRRWDERGTMTVTAPSHAKDNEWHIQGQDDGDEAQLTFDDETLQVKNWLKLSKTKHFSGASSNKSTQLESWESILWHFKGLYGKKHITAKQLTNKAMITKDSSGSQIFIWPSKQLNSPTNTEVSPVNITLGEEVANIPSPGCHFLGMLNMPWLDAFLVKYASKAFTWAFLGDDDHHEPPQK